MKNEVAQETTDKNLYPVLRDKIKALPEASQRNMITWLMSYEGLDCSSVKAYQIMKGIVKGSVSERRDISEYLGYSESFLFKQS